VPGEELLNELNPSQLQAVTHIEGPLLVLAGAGSGKTRVITRRIGYMISQGVNPTSIAAITFTNKAANEMIDRVRQVVDMPRHHGPAVSTFHSFCVLLLRMYGKHIELDSNFTIFDEGDREKVVRSACGDVGTLPTGLTPGKIAGIISRGKTLLLKPEEIVSQLNVPNYYHAHIIRIFNRYENLLKENNALDFDDLLIKVLDLFDNEESKTAIHNRYRYLLIDEYQDTNHVQYLLGKRLSEQTRNICATGDPDQSIYAWRGADLNNILDFEKDFPDAKVIRLEDNYRSTGYILNAADSLIKHNTERKDKDLIPVLDIGRKLTIHVCDSDKSEADRVAELIRQGHKQGVPYSQIAVMSRVNSLFEAVELALKRDTIPYQLAKGVSFFQRREIRDLLAYLRVLVNPSDVLAMERIINTPTRGIGLQSITTLKDYAGRSGISLYEAIFRAESIPELGKSQAGVKRFGELLKSLDQKYRQTPSIKELCSFVVKQTGLDEFYKKIGEKEKRTGDLSPVVNLDQFVATAEEYDDDPEVEKKSLENFITGLSLTNDIDAVETNTDRVILLTMHAAKGLEFDEVIIIGAEEDIIPHSFCQNDAKQIEEERRLLFVGLTRARRILHLCYSQCRTTRGSYKPCFPSRFIKELDPKSIEGLDLTSLSKPPRNNQFVISPKKKEEQPVSSDTPQRQRCQFRPGQRVYHDKFGYGVIQEIYPNGGNYNASISFTNSGLKKLALNIAPLQLVK
jgi:DNA helicase-2/ATP-dependent DNA helicase PcrA